MIKIKRRFHFLEILTLIIFILLFISIAFIIFTIVGIGFLSFLGFEYDSLQSVFIFFIIYFCIASPIDIICTSLLDVLRYVNKLPYVSYKFVEAFFDISLTFILVNILDIFMKSITIPSYTEILFAILSYTLSECIDFMSSNKE